MYKKEKQYRLPGYDYSQNGSYFITIVTKNREHHFGTVHNHQITYTPLGTYIVQNIQQVKNLKKDIQIDEWVVMPNHIHFILSINNNKETFERCSSIRPLISQSVSSFVNHFKGNISRWCKENGNPEFAWQARFHDRVIRDVNEYQSIAIYIQTNVSNWENDIEM